MTVFRNSPSSMPNGRLTATNNRKGQVFDIFVNPNAPNALITDEDVRKAGGQRLKDVKGTPEVLLVKPKPRKESWIFNPKRFYRWN